MGDGLRKTTDKFLFGEDPSQRSELQAGLRDFSHGCFHFFGGVVNSICGNTQKANEDFKRCGDHFGGENLKQISKERRDRSSERKMQVVNAMNEPDTFN